jgi:hypothetical protein
MGGALLIISVVIKTHARWDVEKGVRVESPENIIQPAMAYIANIYELIDDLERRSQVFGLFNLVCLRKNKGAEMLSIIGDL